MQISQQTISTLFIAAAAASQASAFVAPRGSTNKIGLNMPTFDKNMASIFTPNNANTALSLSDNTANDFMNDMQEKAKQNLPEFLYVDIQQAQSRLADNWGWITTSGVLTMALGVGALLTPIFATGVAYDVTVITLGISGVIGVINAFARENGHRAKSALFGLAYLGVAFLMGTNPGIGLDVITLTMAISLGAEGIYETALAAKNKDLQGRPWHFVSGIGSVLASAWLTANIPVSSLFAPGAALGARLTSNGATKVAVGLAGKDLANQRKKSN